MLNIIIITILIFLICFLLMSSGYLITGKILQGTCGDSKDNPCTCSFLEKMKCDKINS